MIHPDLQPELEAQLAAEARARGIALEGLVEQMSRTLFVPGTGERIKCRTTAETVDRILRLRAQTALNGLNIKGLDNPHLLPIFRRQGVNRTSPIESTAYFSAGVSTTPLESK